MGFRGIRRFGEPFARGFGFLGSVGILPFSVDFSTKSDGALPSPLSGSTWAIVSGKAVNTPTLGAELLTDPGLEANYTAGKCDTLTLNGSPTLAQSADVHEGAKAQQFTAAAFNDRLNFPVVAGGVGVWYQFSGWGKQSAGTSGNVALRLFQTGMLPSNTPQAFIYGTGGAYTQFKTAGLSTTTNNIFAYPAAENGSSAFDTVIIDDFHRRVITESSLYALLPSTQADVIVKIMPDVLTDATPVGIVIGADAQTSPANLMMAVLTRHTNNAAAGDVYLIKKVAGVWSSVMGVQGVTIAANAWFEVRRSGSTVKVYYNNIQVSTDQTVSDAAILAGTYHGFFSAGGNAVKQAFFQAN